MCRLWLDNQGDVVWFPADVRVLSLLQNVWIDSGAQPASFPISSWGFFSFGVKGSEHEANSSPLSGAEVKYDWNNISTASLMPSWRAHGSWRVICPYLTLFKVDVVFVRTVCHVFCVQQIIIPHTRLTDTQPSVFLVSSWCTGLSRDIAVRTIVFPPPHPDSPCGYLMNTASCGVVREPSLVWSSPPAVAPCCIFTVCCISEGLQLLLHAVIRWAKQIPPPLLLLGSEISLPFSQGSANGPALSNCILIVPYRLFL